MLLCVHLSLALKFLCGGNPCKTESRHRHTETNKVVCFEQESKNESENESKREYASELTTTSSFTHF